MDSTFRTIIWTWRPPSRDRLRTGEKSPVTVPALPIVCFRSTAMSIIAIWASCRQLCGTLYSVPDTMRTTRYTGPSLPTIISETGAASGLRRAVKRLTCPASTEASVMPRPPS